MKANTYEIISDCISAGILTGYRRAHKHTDTPTEELLTSSIESAIMHEISRYFIFKHDN